jgi:hypothetical protein
MMKFRRYPSLARAAEALKKRGFTDQFTLKKDFLKHHESERLYHPSEIAIVEYHRFLSKDSYQNRITIVFALETIDKLRGILVASYNAYGKVNLLEFMDKVKIKSKKESTL